MEKKEYIKIIKKRIIGRLSKKMISQVNNFFRYKDIDYSFNNYNIGDRVFLKKGTLLHGTYKNIDGLEEIVKSGLISGWFIDGRLSKYPSSIGVWNLKYDYYLDQYVNFYSGGTIEYRDTEGNKTGTEVIPYDEFNKFTDRLKSNNKFRWYMEQTKEARFLPSLVQDVIQIGIIFNGESEEIKELLKYDILGDNFTDKELKHLVNPEYFKKFLIDKQNKDDFFTDRESAILFGIPSCFIEGILVGRKYEKDMETINRIKALLPKAYICNLDGIVIF